MNQYLITKGIVSVLQKRQQAVHFSSWANHWPLVPFFLLHEWMFVHLDNFQFSSNTFLSITSSTCLQLVANSMLFYATWLANLGPVSGLASPLVPLLVMSNGSSQKHQKDFLAFTTGLSIIFWFKQQFWQGFQFVFLREISSWQMVRCTIVEVRVYSKVIRAFVHLVTSRLLVKTWTQPSHHNNVSMFEVSTSFVHTIKMNKIYT